MKTINLNKGLVAKVDDEDYERLLAYTWWAEIDQRTQVIYARGKLRLGRTGCKRGVRRPNPKVRMHQVILQVRPGFEVDHIDHDGLNNQKLNLREASRAQQTRNTRHQRNRASKYKGVEKTQYGWRASIRFNYKHVHLGCFRDEADAARAYDAAAIKYFGEFATLNRVM